jgi:predicted DNA-binding transcriptional regulator AlpA
MAAQPRADLARGGLLEGKGAFLPARAVWERYGVTSMTLYRWIENDALAFPKPIYIGRFRFWKIADLVDWERARPKAGLQAGATASHRSEAA